MARGNITVPKRMEHEFRTLIACLRHAIGPEKMVLAGGTTLEMLWRHRESTDIDLFVSNATVIEIARRGTAELERATARIEKVGEARTGGGARGLVEGTIQGVTFSIAGSDHIARRRKPTARVSGTAVQCGTVEEVLSGKVLGRWVDRVKRSPDPDEWVPVRDVYDVAVAKVLAPDILQAVVAKIGEGTRGRLAEWLEETPEEWIRNDPKRVLAGRYDVDNWRVAGQIAAAVRRNDVREIRTVPRKAKEQGRETGPTGSRW